jgi:RHS repeat-associated protein
LGVHRGSVTAESRYSAFGILESSTASGFGFTGREWDDEIGLYYYRARYYDAIAGRFTGEDPIQFDGEDNNLYAYVRNRPTRFIDPEGETMVIHGYPPSEQKQVENKISRIRRTPMGRRLLECVERSSQTVTIRPPRWWQFGPLRSFFNGKTNNLVFDPNWHPSVPTTSGGVPATGTRILAHELGHACGCVSGQPYWKDERFNVPVNENGVMWEMGQPLRIGY